MSLCYPCWIERERNDNPPVDDYIPVQCYQLHHVRRVCHLDISVVLELPRAAETRLWS